MNNPNSPLVSVITPTFNSERYIRETFQCLISQTFEDWEWVITDDCSTDATCSIISELALEDNRIRFFRSEENRGAAFTRNYSIKQANGRYLAFLDSDDLWDPIKLEKHLAFMQLHKCSISFTAYRIIDSSGDYLGKSVDINAPMFISYKDLLAKKATFGCSTVLVDLSMIGRFEMPLIRTGQDYATWLKLLKRGETACLLKRDLTSYRITPNSISRNKIKKARRQWQIYRKLERLPLNVAFYYFVQYAYHAFFRN